MLLHKLDLTSLLQLVTIFSSVHSVKSPVWQLNHHFKVTIKVKKRVYLSLCVCVWFLNALHCIFVSKVYKTTFPDFQMNPTCEWSPGIDFAHHSGIYCILHLILEILQFPT